MITAAEIPSLTDYPKILIVDDQEKNLFSINAILKSLDAEIHLAHSGKEALSRVIRNDYAVILMDVQMPEINGYDTAKIIRANYNSANTPIIFITANSKTHDNIMQGYESGGVEYLCKPIDSKILISKIKIFLDMHREKLLKNRLNEELQKNNEYLKDFARIVSHDLKQPLRGIGYISEALIEDYGDHLDKEGIKKIGRIGTLSNKLQNLLSSLLQYTQIDYSHVTNEEVYTKKLIEDILETLSPTISKKRAQIKISQTIANFFGNKVLIGEVFHNLITNGLKYNDSSPPVIEIGSEMNKQNQPVFYVKDNGIGIPEEMQECIFKIFKRLHAEKDYEGGMGAGLSIVKKIIDNHKGSIWLDSKEGQGTTVYFTIGDR